MTFTKIEWIIGGIIVAMLALVAVSTPTQMEAKRQFMTSCAAQEPEYRCEVQWKQMHPDPIVVLAPLNR